VQVSERLRKALRAFHFQQWEPRIRRELAEYLDGSAESVSFVDWNEHDQVLQRYHQLWQAATVGHCPEARREWRKADRSVFENTLALRAHLAADWTGYLYVPEYLAGFASYDGYCTCEVPLVCVGRFDGVILRATRLLGSPKYFGCFGCILSDLSNVVWFDLSEAVDYARESVPVRVELYSVIGIGSVAAEWVFHL